MEGMRRHLKSYDMIQTWKFAYFSKAELAKTYFRQNDKKNYESTRNSFPRKIAKQSRIQSRIQGTIKT